jgi:hypothetical protein
MSAITHIKTEIRLRAAERGFYLHRYQSNGRRLYQPVVSYALHTSQQKPRFSKDCDGAICRFYTVEGKTEKCEAYKHLSSLLRSI